ncbi:WD40/YVTN/BNR-like repeat-containing protein [Daejeonella oryzae]|uniref:WD40/YVTN/BNR-like repeat-containing protein n=1 Tax=Daejeonella oryzae TaxID=1122943 RepID=UPI000478C77B|nr:YCF48-related protein [Daejeonella oryzae]
MKKITFASFLVQVLIFSTVSAQEITLIDSGKNSSIRGLSIVDDSVAWISGSNGYTALSTNSGKTWKWNQHPKYNKLDFRDIEAFSSREAIIVSAGTPAVILKTADGGITWKEVYFNDSPEIFLDGMDFWTKDHGIVYGDPINGKIQLLETRDAGITWKNISNNIKIPLAEGEASFAASGTTIRTGKKGKVWIATGGMKSRVFHSKNFGKTWKAFECPIIQGNNSSGPFSIAVNSKNMVAVGGDYLIDTLRTNNMLLSGDAGKTWATPQISPFGYRSAVEYITQNILVSTGPTGTDISIDGGKTWKNISPQGFNTVRKAKNGKMILLTGSKGKIAKLYLPDVLKD